MDPEILLGWSRGWWLDKLVPLTVVIVFKSRLDRYEGGSWPSHGSTIEYSAQFNLILSIP